MLGFVVLISLLGVALAAYLGDWWIVLWVAIIAIVYAVIQYFISGLATMMLTGANEITKKDCPKLYNTVENLSITTGLPMPKVYLIDDPAPNAFATGRDPKHAMVRDGTRNVARKELRYSGIAHCVWALLRGWFDCRYWHEDGVLW